MKEQYFYKAYKRDGSEVKGLVEASSREAALRWVKDQGLIPSELRPLEFKAPGTSWLGMLKMKKRKSLSSQDVLFFTKQMAVLLKGGLPIDRALKVLSQSLGGGKAGDLCTRVLAWIEKGASLSEALEREEGFSAMYITLVRAGEQSGSLDMVLERLSCYLEEELKTKKEVLSALIYPSLLLSVGLISVYLLLVVVIPRFSIIFSDLGQEIPLPTKIMLALSWLARKTWFLLPLGVLLLLGLLKYASDNPSWRRRGEGWLLYRLPLVSTFVRKRELSRFSRAMAILLGGGVTLSRSLELVTTISPFQKIKEELERLAEDIKKGRSLSRLMGGSPLFLPFCLHMVEVGEETGNLEEAFSNIATALEEDLREGTKRFLNLLEPSIILFMGIVIGSMVISMLLAIFSINDIGF